MTRGPSRGPSSLPSQVLHGMLVDPPVAIVGLSNWTLDAAKMNRAVLLRRPEPREADIALTAASIVAPTRDAADDDDADADGAGAPKPGGAMAAAPWLAPLAVAYHRVYTTQRGRDFVGMRDYYQLVKILALEVKRLRQRRRAELAAAADAAGGADSPAAAAEKGGTARAAPPPPGGGAKLTSAALDFALRRCFGGKPQLLERVLATFHAQCFGGGDGAAAPPPRAASRRVAAPPVARLIAANLADRDARHLMVLTRRGAALPLLFGLGLLRHAGDDGGGGGGGDASPAADAPPADDAAAGAAGGGGGECLVLVGSAFADDRSELRLVEQVNAVKAAMARGATVVLLNMDPIYEALCDACPPRPTKWPGNP